MELGTSGQGAQRLVDREPPWPCGEPAFAASDTILERACFITFRLSGRLFALPLGVMREVALFCALERPPSCPPVLEGLLNLGGEAVPVLRLDRLLKLPEITPGVGSRLLIVADAKGPFALLVDEVMGMEEPEADRILPVAASDTFNGCIAAQLQSGTETLSLLNLERLLVRREREVIFHFASEEQQRARLLTETVR
jgi:purine-binding chemotaxis protein CheW